MSIDINLEWNKGRSGSYDLEYYYCDYQNFKLRLTHRINPIMTRVEIKLGKSNIYVVEEEVTKEVAISKMVYFLLNLSNQIQTIATIKLPSN